MTYIKSISKEIKKRLDTIPDIFVVFVIQIKNGPWVETGGGLCWCWALKETHPKQTKNPKQTPEPYPCCFEYLLLLSIVSHTGGRLRFCIVSPPSSNLPLLLLLLHIQPWLRSFVCLLESRALHALFLPSEIRQSLAHGWWGASHLAFAIAELGIRAGVHLAWIHSSVMWCLYMICQSC